MKFYLTGALCAALLLSFSFSANAALVSRLGGLAYYDTDANLTWLADANYAQTSGYDAAGLMMWADANAWAASLNINGVTGWRLPYTVQPDAGCTNQNNGSFGYNCTGSEMGNLFYNVLSNPANYAIFSNIQPYRYWSATALFDPYINDAWIFNFQFGDQIGSLKTNSYFAWAVHSGDVGATSPVPVPAAVWLFGSGLLGLVSMARRKTT